MTNEIQSKQEPSDKGARLMAWMKKCNACAFSVMALLFLLSGREAAAMPTDPIFKEFMNICESSTLSDASAKGDALGWPRMSDENWHSSFVADNGGTLEDVGWRPKEEVAVSFWIAKGRASYRACSYSVTDPSGPAGLMEALTERFGPPSYLNKTDLGTTAFWNQGSMEASLSQVGSSIGIQISYDQRPAK